MTKEENGLKRSAFLYLCTTKHSGNISSIAKCVCVAYNSECCCGTETPHLRVDTQILSSMHGQRGDKGLADQGDWEGASLCPPWSLEDKHSTDPGGHQAQEPD